jgi:predicted amidohydrolase
MVPEPYLAAALQLRAWSVEGAADAQAARAGMLAAIARLDRELFGVKGFLEKFSGQPLKLVVLPEYLFSGFETGRVADFPARAAWAADGPEYAALGAVAVRHGLFIAGNAYETDAQFPQLYFQTSFVVDPAGAVVLRYRRLYSLYTPTPHDVWTAYRRLNDHDALFPVADTAIGRLGCIASEEILYPEIARTLALKGAEVLLHSSSEQGALLATPKQVARRARAFESIAYLVSANTAGIEGGGLAGMSADGNSAVLDWRGQVLAEALSGENCNAFAEIDLGAVRRARAKPGMSNTLARQRLELFRETYAGTVWPADTLAGRAPEKGEQLRTLEAVIAERRAKGLI